MNAYRDVDDIDITQEAPTTEPERQYYFIKKAKEYVRRESEKAGRPLTFATVTLGCQMNEMCIRDRCWLTTFKHAHLTH